MPRRREIVIVAVLNSHTNFQMSKNLPAVFAITLALCGSAFADEWQTLTNCRLIENESNDGDSFHVKADGEEYLFRLYHVDTPESEIDSAVADRVAVQAEHFGLTQEESLRGGEKAKEFTEKVLAKPFSVVTRWQKAMGRSKLQRYYAVVLVGGNDDLAELLVKAGFARAFGQVVDAPKGKSMADYARMEKTAKAGKMGLYGGNKPKTSESSESRLGGSPSRLPVRNQPVEPSNDGDVDVLSSDIIPQISIGDFQ
jgi:endonuclease YncB( thermonuclease family)